MGLLGADPFPGGTRLHFSGASTCVKSWTTLASRRDVLRFVDTLLAFESSSPSIGTEDSTAMFSGGQRYVPITPALPVSSLSAEVRRTMYSASFASDVTGESIGTRAQSSYPWTDAVLQSGPRSQTFPTKAVSDSTREGSSSSVSWCYFGELVAFTFATSFSFSSGISSYSVKQLPVEESDFSPSAAITTFFSVYFSTE